MQDETKDQPFIVMDIPQEDVSAWVQFINNPMVIPTIYHENLSSRERFWLKIRYNGALEPAE